MLQQTHSSPHGSTPETLFSQPPPGFNNNIPGTIIKQKRSPCEAKRLDASSPHAHEHQSAAVQSLNESHEVLASLNAPYCNVGAAKLKPRVLWALVALPPSLLRACQRLGMSPTTHPHELLTRARRRNPYLSFIPQPSQQAQCTYVCVCVCGGV